MDGGAMKPPPSLALGGGFRPAPALSPSPAATGRARLPPSLAVDGGFAGAPLDSPVLLQSAFVRGGQGYSGNTIYDAYEFGRAGGCLRSLPGSMNRGAGRATCVALGWPMAGARPGCRRACEPILSIFLLHLCCSGLS